jgi:cytochrome c peroxidase
MSWDLSFQHHHGGNLCNPQAQTSARMARMRRGMPLVWLGLMAIVLLAACGSVRSGTASWQWQLPKGVPAPPVPANNPMTEAKFELGRHLFYDARLSGNGTQACATCHMQGFAFTDAARRSTGSTGRRHPRNSQPLVNVAWYTSFNWADPNLTKIEQQMQRPLFGGSPVEMGVTGKEDAVLRRLREDPQMAALFKAAFPAERDPFHFENITAAIATFVRGLVSFDSAYDRYIAGDVNTMSTSALRGMALFNSDRLKCAQCHSGFNFTAATSNTPAFFNTGLYNIDGKGAYPPGNTGLMSVTNDPRDMGKFRVPTLRNVALTAPYMHDGSMDTLEEVVRAYERGGRKIDEGEHAGDGARSPLKDSCIAGFSLSDEERRDLITFLAALTDESLVSNPRFSEPRQINQ